MYRLMPEGYTRWIQEGNTVALLRSRLSHGDSYHSQAKIASYSCRKSQSLLQGTALARHVYMLVCMA